MIHSSDSKSRRYRCKFFVANTQTVGQVISIWILSLGAKSDVTVVRNDIPVNFAITDMIACKQLPELSHRGAAFKFDAAPTKPSEKPQSTGPETDIRLAGFG